MKTKLRFLLLSSLFVLNLQAARLELSDGSQIMGTLEKIHEGKVYFETTFAGTLEIDQTEVVAIQSSESLFRRTESGEVFSGPVQATEDGTLVVKTSGGSVTTEMNAVRSSWAPGNEDPVAVAEKETIESQIRKWKYEAGVDLSFRSGNTENSKYGLSFRATLEGPKDRLRIFGAYSYAETESVRTEDEILGGIRYTNFFTEHIGWFVRQGIEVDEFEGLDFRSTTAGGLTYKFFDTDISSLETSAGLSYRYDVYSDGTEDGFPGLDFGLSYYRKLTEWAEFNFDLAYLPSFNDFGDYLLNQDASVDMPLGTSDKWKLRLGVANQYNSEPSPGRDELDTHAYALFLMNWE